MKIIGKTFEWKKELKSAGLSWNAYEKCWEGSLNDSFAGEQIRRGIESRELKNIEAGMELRNGPGMNQIDNLQY